MNCPKCGKEVTDGATFCKYCGSSISPRKQVCPKCGKENDEDALFCEGCGTSLVQEEKALTKKDSRKTKEKLSHIFSMILSISMIVYFSLSIMLLGSSYLSMVTINGFTSIGLKEIIDLFQQVKNGYPDTSLGYQVIDMANGGLILTMAISTLLFFAAIITFGVLGIVKEAKCLKQKKQSSSDIYLIANILSTAAFYALMYAILTITQGTLAGMGNGVASVFGLGVFLLILKLAYRFVFSFQKGKGLCFASYICIAVLVFQTISLVSGFAGSYALVTPPTSSVTAPSQVGFISFFYSEMTSIAKLISAGSITVEEANIAIAYLVIPMVLTILIIIAVCVLSVLTARNLFMAKKSATLIVFPAIMLFLSILLTTLMPIEIICLKAVNTNISDMLELVDQGSIGFTSVAASSIILANGIVSFVLKAKAKENTYLL